MLRLQRTGDKELSNIRKKAMSNGLDILVVEKGKRQKYLGLQLFIDKEIAEDVLRDVKEIIPPSTENKLFWQNPTSLYITLQSTSLGDTQVSDLKIEQLVADLEKFFHGYPGINSLFVFPLFAQSGLIGVLNDEEKIYELREKITHIWNQHGLDPVLGEQFWNFPYSFFRKIY